MKKRAWKSQKSRNEGKGLESHKKSKRVIESVKMTTRCHQKVAKKKSSDSDFSKVAKINTFYC